MASNKKTALITGITGQDGSYLAELLLMKGYRVHGIVRRASSFNRGRIDHLSGTGEDAMIPTVLSPAFRQWLIEQISQGQGGQKLNFHLSYGDMTDSANLERIVGVVAPDEIYNLAAQSHVQVSFETPEYTASADAVGTLRLLESIKNSDMIKKTKFYQASTSEMFGKVAESPQTETTPLHPQSPYGVAKVYAHLITTLYREAFGLFACNGILFNHESPRRGENFVSRKVTMTIAQILAGKQDDLSIGNLNASRDWGFAGDYVDAMWRMLQQDKPEDFVIATGKTHTVRQFIETAFGLVGVSIKWEGKGTEEKGVDSETGSVRVRVDPKYFRPLEVDYLQGDYSKAQSKLGWSPTVGFEELVRMMLDHDLEENGLNSKEILRALTS